MLGYIISAAFFSSPVFFRREFEVQNPRADALGLLQRRGVSVQHLGVNCFDHVDTVSLILCFIIGR